MEDVSVPSSAFSSLKDDSASITKRRKLDEPLLPELSGGLWGESTRSSTFTLPGETIASATEKPFSKRRNLWPKNTFPSASPPLTSKDAAINFPKAKASQPASSSHSGLKESFISGQQSPDEVDVGLEKLHVSLPPDASSDARPAQKSRDAGTPQTGLGDHAMDVYDLTAPRPAVAAVVSDSGAQAAADVLDMSGTEAMAAAKIEASAEPGASAPAVEPTAPIATGASQSAPPKPRKRIRDDLSINLDGDLFLKTWNKPISKERPKTAPGHFSQYQATQMASHPQQQQQQQQPQPEDNVPQRLQQQAAPRRKVAVPHDPDKENRKEDERQRLALGGFNGDYWNLPTGQRRSRQPQLFTYKPPEPKRRPPRPEPSSRQPRSVDDDEDSEEDEEEEEDDEEDAEEQQEDDTAASESDSTDLEELQRQKEARQAELALRRARQKEARDAEKQRKREENERFFHERRQGKPVLDYLYLGNRDVATNLDWLRENNVRHIVNVTLEVKNEFEDHPEWPVNYKRIGIQDNREEPLNKDGRSFDEVLQFIQAARDKQESVLVHCGEGRSRSISYLIAYLMMHPERWDLRRAYEHMCGVNPHINVNEGFKRQLMELEYALFSVSSIDLVTGSRRRAASAGNADMVSPTLGRASRALSSSQSAIQRGRERSASASQEQLPAVLLPLTQQPPLPWSNPASQQASDTQERSLSASQLLSASQPPSADVRDPERIELDASSAAIVSQQDASSASWSPPVPSPDLLDRPARPLPKSPVRRDFLETDADARADADAEDDGDAEEVVGVLSGRPAPSVVRGSSESHRVGLRDPPAAPGPQWSARPAAAAAAELRFEPEVDAASDADEVVVNMPPESSDSDAMVLVHVHSQALRLSPIASSAGRASVLGGPYADTPADAMDATDTPLVASAAYFRRGRLRQHHVLELSFGEHHGAEPTLPDIADLSAVSDDAAPAVDERLLDDERPSTRLAPADATPDRRGRRVPSAPLSSFETSTDNSLAAPPPPPERDAPADDSTLVVGPPTDESGTALMTTPQRPEATATVSLASVEDEMQNMSLVSPGVDTSRSAEPPGSSDAKQPAAKRSTKKKSPKHDPLALAALDGTLDGSYWQGIASDNTGRRVRKPVTLLTL